LSIFFKNFNLVSGTASVELSKQSIIVLYSADGAHSF